MLKFSLLGGETTLMERFVIKKSVTIGRNLNCDITLPFKTISGFHCKIFLEKESLFVQDLFSKNGTILNKKKIKKAQLLNGDIIDLGGVKLEVEFSHGIWYIIVRELDSLHPSSKTSNKEKILPNLLNKIRQELGCDAIYLFEKLNKSVFLKELLADTDSPPPSRTIINNFLGKRNKESLWAIRDLPVSSESITNLHPHSVLLSSFSIKHNLDLWFYCYWNKGCNDPDNAQNIIRNCFFEFFESVKTFLEEESKYIKSKVEERGVNASEINYEMVGKSPAFLKTKELAIKAAYVDFPVLLIGESGTGKELFARFIYKNSSRKDKPFIAVNCPSIPGNLAETELFGHKKGAFTDAIEDRIGKIKFADGGTLFLDQVESLPITIQSKLLRFMQEREFERVGDNHLYRSDVRLIAATNENPEDLISEGRMRLDFYFRIAYLPIEIPNLSERKEDIPLLCDFFLKKHKDKLNKNVKGFSKKAINFLENIKFTGNIRELENLVCRIVTFTENEIIDEKDLEDSLLVNHLEDSKIVSGLSEKPYKKAKEDFNSIYIEKLLGKTDGNIAEAAKISGLTRKTIYQLKKKFEKKI